jgi:hypothetical protein
MKASRPDGHFMLDLGDDIIRNQISSPGLVDVDTDFYYAQLTWNF